MQDLHMHTVFSDGKNTPEEMVQEAIRRGLETVGISDHSSGDPVGMTLETSVVYRTEIARLKKKYAGQTLVREQIRVPKARKAALLRRMYESYMPYQTDACDGVRIVEAGAEGVIMADDSDRMRLVISADSAEAAEDAVAEVMMRLGLT